MKNSVASKTAGILVSVAIPIVMYMALVVCYPQNVNFDSAFAMVIQAITPAILAWGVCFDLKVGNWDFSVGAAVLAASIIGGNIALQLNLGIVGIVICCTLVGALSGALTGFVYILLKVPSIIVSIGVTLILESLCAVAFGGSGVSVPAEFILFGGNIPKLIVLAVAFGIAYYLYNYRRFGYHVRAVGNGTTIARQNGINIYRVKFLAFMAAGVFAGIYSVLMLGSTGITKAVSAPLGTMGLCFDAMMCVFVGMSLPRSVNLIAAVFIGSVIMQIIKLALMLFGMESAYNQIVIALFVLIFMSISSRSDIFKKVFSRKKTIAAEQ